MTENKNTTDLQARAVRLFSYIEKALSMDDTIVRDFRSTVAAPTPWWIADLPTDVDSLHVRPLDTNQQTAEDGSDQEGWLRVQKQNIKPHPTLPEVLVEWVPEVTPLTEPKPLSSLERKIRFNQDSKRVQDFKDFRRTYEEGQSVPEALRDWVVISIGQAPEPIDERYITEHFSDHPELQSLLKSYSAEEWEPWAQRVVKLYKANLLYDQLYALRLQLKNEGDNYELLWGQGLLTWEAPHVGTIYSPLFLTPVALEFDPTKRIIRILPDPMSRGFVEIASLYELDNPAEMDIVTWADAINAEPFDFWHYETLRSQSQWLINTLSNASEDFFSETLASAPEVGATPSIWNAPVIFARKRSNDLWSKYAGLIRKDIEQNESEPTAFIADLVGAYDEQPAREEQQVVQAEVAEDRSLPLSDSELFFPLPWNDEQKRIAERLGANYGVVVKGPPGTGKTHTIANLISRFLAQGKTVLVTSQTSKALAVLRDKLPASIRSLAVSQLHQTASKDDVLQQSIAEISSHLGERHTRFSEANADSVRNELSTVREQKAKVASDIRQFVLTDSSVTLDLDGEIIKPLEAAQFVSKCSEDGKCQWFIDDVPVGAELNFAEDDLLDAFELLSKLSPDQRELHNTPLPDIALLPDEAQARAVFASYKELEGKAGAAVATLSEVEAELTPETLVDLLGQSEKAQKILKSLSQPFEKEVFTRAATSKNQRTKWLKALEKIESRVQTIAEHGNELLGHTVVGSTTIANPDCFAALEQLAAKAEGVTRINKLARFLLPTNCKKILEAYKVDGQEPLTTELLKLLRLHFEVQQAQQDVTTLLVQAFSLPSLPKLEETGEDIVALEVFLRQLRTQITFHDDFAQLREWCDKIPKLKSLTITELTTVDRLIEVLNSQAAANELKLLSTLVEDWKLTLAIPKDQTAHAIFQELASALEARNSGAWNKALESLRILEEQKRASMRLRELADKITLHARRLYSELVHLANTKESYKVPENLKVAWKRARLSTWLDSIHDHDDIDTLQGRYERLSKKEMQLNADLITILAWQRQIDKVSKPQRDALMAWSHEMKKFGKGTGKYALTHLRAAQGALQDAKDAVPVWIMPLHRVAQMFAEPKTGMFDVVIVDEASQCDLRGLTVGYLGKQLLVVGDPEQISPEGVFKDQERIFELISRYLYDIPHKESFSITSSLFDLAKIRLSNIIQLNEHFRCVPEIIAFSNHYIYEGKLRPLRYPNPNGLLSPALVPIPVEGGYQNRNNKVNEPEAKALVAKLVELLNDPKYDRRPDGSHCTFGIVSLLGDDQAKYIEKLIRDLILKGEVSEKTVEERRIECGDAYKFQGDERDVMLLSMVRALDPDKLNDTVQPLVDEGAKRRFNVAASRARDQMFLFHSLPLTALANKNDWRYKLLSWFYNPKTEEIRAGREALKKEFDAGQASQFSVDVGNLILDRGYQVIPEYPIIGYRIDLVVQGTSARLAVECDGDQYHADRWEEDQTRERQLRRAGGFEFWRIAGSSFYRHKEKALDSLWTRLDELGIKPLAES